MKIFKRFEKKCCVCGKAVFSVHSMYCRVCARVAHRMKSRRFSPKAVAGVWEYVRAHGYRCYYTQVPLEMENIRSPWFCVFDHLIPMDASKVVLCSALINEMKTALSVTEFWSMVQQLADYVEKNKKIKKIRLGHWRHDLDPKEAKVKELSLGMGPKGRGERCFLCGRPVANAWRKYCPSCVRFTSRLEIQGFGTKTVLVVLDYVRAYGYTCYYTGMPLDMANARSPWYGVFDCCVPKDRSKIVLTSALFNEMKSDLSIEEFWYYIKQLANHKRHGTKIRKKKLVYWYRLASS